MKIIVLILPVFLLVGSRQVNSISPRESDQDYWYVETLEVGDVYLPSGVQVTPSDPAAVPRSYLTITNTNKQPVYVMSLAYKDVLVMATPDANWKNRVNGAQEAASYLAAPDHPARLTIERLISLDQSLKDENVFSGNPPPKNEPIPAAQASELLLVYNGQVIVVPFTLSYSANPKYYDGAQSSSGNVDGENDLNNGKEAVQVNGNPVSQGIVWVVGAAFVCVLALAVIIVSRRHRHG